MDCNYHFPIDLASIGIPICMLNLSKIGDYNPDLVWIYKILKRFHVPPSSCMEIKHNDRRPRNVEDTGNPRHHGGIIGTPQARRFLKHHGNVGTRGLSGTFNYAKSRRYKKCTKLWNFSVSSSRFSTVEDTGSSRHHG